MANSLLMIGSAIVASLSAVAVLGTVEQKQAASVFSEPLPVTTPDLALLAAYEECSRAADVRLLSPTEAVNCSETYLRLKLSFLPDMDMKAFMALSIEDRWDAQQRGYAALRDWRKDKDGTVVDSQCRQSEPECSRRDELDEAASLAPPIRGASENQPVEVMLRTDDLIDLVGAWVVHQSGLPFGDTTPELHIVAQGSPASLLARKSGAAESARVVAFYSDVEEKIFVDQSWTGRSAADISVLVHELVHHLQDRNQLSYACPANREELAYEVQDKWLRQFGLSLASEFDIDDFTLKIATTCPL